MGPRPTTFQAASQPHLHAVLDSVFPICVTAFNHRILTTNLAYRTTFGDPGPGGLCHDSRPGPSCHTEDCPLVKIERGADEYFCEANKTEGSRVRTFIVTARPFRDDSGTRLGIVESFQDISRRKELETEQQRLIRELEGALAEVRVLRGLLPICSACKKIRDAEGSWSEVEQYVSKHSEATFTHGMCPDCLRAYYPEYCKGD